jgi:poly-gamma-glutamate synthesis protein (capsule biosynthesis protein)
VGCSGSSIIDSETADDWRLNAEYNVVDSFRGATLFGIALKSGDSTVIFCQKTNTLTLAKSTLFVRWKSSDSNVVTVNNDGIVNGISKGNATISAYLIVGEPVAEEKVAEIPVIIDREALPPEYPIPDARFVAKDNYFVNPGAKQSENAKLSFVGDIMCLGAQTRSATKGDTYDFTNSFSAVRPLLAESDFSMGNLETMLADSQNNMAYQTRKYGHTYCNAPSVFLDAVRYAGFDAIASINNHSLDTGLDGLLETIANYNRYKILNVGTYANETDPRFLLVEVNGIKVGFVAYSMVFNHLGNVFTEAERATHLSVYSMENAKRDIDAAKTAGAEYIISYAHWGVAENIANIEKAKSAGKELGVSDVERTYAQELADVGVDYIIGANPHVLWEYDVIKAVDGRNVPVAYSLGNFLSSMNDKEGDLEKDTVILQLNLEKKGDKILLKSDGYVPCYIAGSPEEEAKGWITVPCDSEWNGIDSQTLADSKKRIAKALGDKIREVKP